MKLSNPIIIMGMHRSGTSILTKLLSELGVWVGGDLSINNESLYFQHKHIALMREFKSSWATPRRFRDAVLKKESLDRICTNYAAYLESPNFVEQYLSNQPGECPEFWGWKDPRNTLMIPIFHNVFKTMKIIYIERNGEDVVSSLRKRSNLKHSIGCTFKGLYNKNPKFFDSAKYISSDKQALKIRSFYLDCFHSDIERYALQDQAIHIQYEDLVSNPSHVLRQLLNFLGMSANNVDQVSLMVRQSPLPNDENTR